MGAVLDGGIECGLETDNPSGDMIDLMDVVQQGRLLRCVLKAHGTLHPRKVGLRPGLHRGRRSPSMPQQKFTQPMTRPQLILLGRLPRANEIAQGFVRRVGDPDRRQIASAITPRELHRVASVRLDPIAGFDRHQGRGHHLALHLERRQLPIQHVPRRARFVADAQLRGRPQFLHQLPNRLRAIGNDAERSNLPVRFRNRDRDRFCVDIKTDKSYVAHDRLLRMWLCDVWTPIHAA